MEGMRKKNEGRLSIHNNGQTTNFRKKNRRLNFPRIIIKIHHRLNCVCVFIISSFKIHHNHPYFVILIENVLHLVDRLYSFGDIYLLVSYPLE